MKCIYLRTNLVNGKQYVGQTIDFKQREHEWKSVKRYSGGIIDKARKKYGVDNFETKILKECSTIDELDYWEIYYIKELNTKTPNGYNLTDGGEGFKGLEFTEEHKRNISKAIKGRKFTEEHRQHISQAKKGIKVSEETKRRLSDVLKGRKITEEHRKKISEGNKGRIVTQSTRDKISRSHIGIGLGEKRPWMSERMKGENNPFYGRTHTKETINKIKKANIGRTSHTKGKTLEELYGKEKAVWLRKHAINNAYKVDQIDKITGVLIRQWDCAKDAARELGLDYTNINKCVNGKHKTAFGYIWKRVA